jgi:hypothetical protein
MDSDSADTQARSDGRWLALADDQVTVLASGDSEKSARRRARLKGHPSPILICVPYEEVEIPNDDLLAAMKEAEECTKCDHIYVCQKCGMTCTDGVEAFMESLDEPDPD